MVYIISVGEKLDKATGLMVEAKDILEKPEVREQMRLQAYLGELGETECLNVALLKAEEAVKILSEHMPENVGNAQEIVDNIHKRLDELTKPKKIIKPIEPVKKEDIIKPKIEKKPVKKRRSKKKVTK